MGWFQDLEPAIATFRARCPQVETFDSIEVNIYGDFTIRAGKEVYIIAHASRNVWHYNRKENNWEQV